MTNARHAADQRVDTLPALKHLVAALGGKLRPVAKIMGTSYSHLWSVMKGEKPPPTLNAMAMYANRVYNETGVKMVLTVTPDLKMYWSVNKDVKDIGAPFEFAD